MRRRSDSVANVRAAAWALSAVGGMLLIAGFTVVPLRAWASLLWLGWWLTGFGLIGAFFVALHYVTGASWSAAIRRVPEALSAALPLGAVLVLGVLIARAPIYPWADPAVAFDGFKGDWLAFPFLLGRALVYVVVWVVLARVLVRSSRAQDADGGFAHTRRSIRLSAGFIVVFAITLCLASFDWIMTLEPFWFSTMYGVYHFAGLASAGVAAVILLAVWLERSGPLDGVLSAEHRHDLGKLLFAFSSFWMYIWFSQYMLIWYTGIPEESAYFATRMNQHWLPLMIAILVLCWVVPFLALMPRSAKRERGPLVVVALVVLLGHALDLYVMIFPPIVGEAPVFGLWEAGALLAGFGMVTAISVAAFTRAAPFPVRDPWLHESLHYHA